MGGWVAPRDDRGPIAVGPRSGPDCTVGPRSGPDCTVGPRSGPDCAVGPRSGPDCAVGPRSGEIALSLVALLYKAASSATPAVRMVPGRSARILGGCGAVGDIARAYFFLCVCVCVFATCVFPPPPPQTLKAFGAQPR